MAERCRRQRLHVIGQHVIPPLHCRMRPARHRQHRRRARGCAGLEVRADPRRPHQRHDVGHHWLGQRHAAHHRHRGVDRLQPRDRGHAVFRRVQHAGPHAVLTHDPALIFLGRIGQDLLEQEPVELRLRQRIRALLLDRVLRGDDGEAGTQLVLHAIDGDMPLLHGLQQRGLRLGWRAVDLVRE